MGSVRIYYDRRGRMMEREGYSARLHWSPAMLCYLKRNYATTKNQELAGCLGISVRTLTRKAREMGLDKDAAWLRAVYTEHCRYAQSATRLGRNPGCFRKGGHANPGGEFSSERQPSPEALKRKADSLRAYNRLNHDKLSLRAIKGWQTRRNNQ